MGVKVINSFIVLSFIGDTPCGHMYFLCPCVSLCTLKKSSVAKEWPHHRPLYSVIYDLLIWSLSVTLFPYLDGLPVGLTPEIGVTTDG